MRTFPRIAFTTFALVLALGFAPEAQAKSESEITFQTDQKYSYSEKEVNEFKARFWVAVKSRVPTDGPSLKYLAAKAAGFFGSQPKGAMDFLDDTMIREVRITRAESKEVSMNTVQVRINATADQIKQSLIGFRSDYLKTLIAQNKVALLYMGASVGCDGSLSNQKCQRAYMTLNDLIYSDLKYLRKDIFFYDPRIALSEMGRNSNRTLVAYSVSKEELAQATLR